MIRTLDNYVHDPDDVEAVTFDDFSAILYDRRKFHRPSVRRKDGTIKFYEPPLRSQSNAWRRLTGITLHQTACDMGTRLERYDTIGAHFSVLRPGATIWHCDTNRIVYHGNGWNAQCAGIEINGLYPGLEDDPTTVVNEALRTTWDDKSTAWREQPMQVTPQAMKTTRMLIRWIIIQAQRNGATIKVLCTHRQSSLDRRNDPGQAICEQVLVPLWNELGLHAGGPGFKVGGYPNPTAWTGERGPDGSPIPY